MHAKSVLLAIKRLSSLCCIFNNYDLFMVCLSCLNWGHVSLLFPSSQCLQWKKKITFCLSMASIGFWELTLASYHCEITYLLCAHENKLFQCFFSSDVRRIMFGCCGLIVCPFRIAGRVRSLSTALWSLTHLTALHLSDNSLSRIPPDIAKLQNLVYLDLSSNKIRSLPAELGNMVSLRWVV